MTRIFIKGKFTGGEAVSPPDDIVHYLRDVLRANQGDRVITVADDGREFIARINLEGGEILLDIVEELPNSREIGLTIHLFVGLLKGKKIERVIRDVGELGASSITPFISLRTIPGMMGDERVLRLKKIALEQSRLSRRNQVLEVNPPIDLEGALVSAPGERLVFWEGEGFFEEAKNLKTFFENYLDDKGRPPGEVSIFTGPEGGFSAEEIEMFRGAGFVVLGLGDRIIRAETAPAIATTIIQYEWGDIK